MKQSSSKSEEAFCIRRGLFSVCVTDYCRAHLPVVEANTSAWKTKLHDYKAAFTCLSLSQSNCTNEHLLESLEFNPNNDKEHEKSLI